MSRHVLVVDDNAALAENIAEILEEEGFATTVATGPEDALAAARRRPIDAAVLDVRMPGMDGVTLTARLTQLHPGATVVLMTAHTRDERLRDAIRAGVRAVLPKPVPLDALLATLAAPNLAEPIDVLMVEDDIELAASVAEALEPGGFRVRLARSLASARRQAEQRAPEVLIVDVRLPDGDGALLAEELAARHGTPVVLVSGLTSELAARARCPRAASFLAKPVAPDLLAATLRRVVTSTSTRARAGS